LRGGLLTGEARYKDGVPSGRATPGKRPDQEERGGGLDSGVLKKLPQKTTAGRGPKKMSRLTKGATPEREGWEKGSSSKDYEKRKSKERSGKGGDAEAGEKAEEPFQNSC